MEAELLEKDEELERERERREAELLEKEYEWSIHEDEIKRINEGLEIPIDTPELYELAKDLFHHPSKYPDVIRTMRERSELQSIMTNRWFLPRWSLYDVEIDDFLGLSSTVIACIIM